MQYQLVCMRVKRSNMHMYLFFAGNNSSSSIHTYVYIHKHAYVCKIKVGGYVIFKLNGLYMCSYVIMLSRVYKVCYPYVFDDDESTSVK